MTSRTLQTALLVGAATLAGCTKTAPRLSSNSTGQDTTVAMIASGFTNFHRVTPRVVYVNPELASLCVGASKDQVDAARQKFGPHANAAVLIYMNHPAAEAFAMDVPRYPVGAVIVKHKLILGYRDREGNEVPSGNGVGGMIKRPPGYDPEHGDWEYFYFEDPSHIQSGRMTSCVQCHNAARASDHVFGTWHAEPAR